MIEYTGRWTAEDKERLLDHVDSLTPRQIELIESDFWNIWGRPEQTPYLDIPFNKWNWWLLICGRGFGKTKSGVEWVLWEVMNAKIKLRIFVVAATASDLVGTIITGPSGFLASAPKFMMPHWDKGNNWLIFPNGCEIRLFSAESPERLRGPNAHHIWFDEVAAYPQIESGNVEALNQGLFVTRLPIEGGNKVVVTTTPKNFPWLRAKMKEAETNPKFIITRGSSYDNALNLGDNFFQNLKHFEGTEFGRQEIYGDIVDLGGAKPVDERDIQIWDPHKHFPELVYCVVSVDPAYTEKTSNDPTATWVLGVFWDEKIHDYSIIVCDVWEAHLAYPDLRNRLKSVWNTEYGFNEIYPNVIIIEQKASGISITQDLAREDIKIHPYNPGRDDKFTRMSKAAVVIKQKRFYVMGGFNGRKYAEWCTAAIDQLINFPAVEHDDFVDALSQALNYLNDNNFVGSHPNRQVIHPDNIGRDSSSSSTAYNFYSV